MIMGDYPNIKNAKRTARRNGEFSASIAIPQRYAGMRLHRIVDEQTDIIVLTPAGTDPATAEAALDRIVESLWNPPIGS